MTTALRRARVILGILLTNVVAVLALGKLVYTALGANIAKFPALPVQLATLKKQLDELDAALLVKGNMPDRKSKLGALVSSLHQIKAHLQGLCDNLSFIDGEALAAFGGMRVSAVVVRAKKLLAVVPGPHANGVKLIAFAKQLSLGLRGAIQFNWSYSADQGKTWITPKPTTDSFLVLDDLTPGLEYLFRVYASGPKADGVSSPTVHYTIH